MRDLLQRACALSIRAFSPLWRSVVLSVLVAAVASSAALAQTSAPPPPVHTFVDGNRVDLLSGSVIVTQTVLSIGAPDSGMSLSRTFIGGSSGDSLTGTVNQLGGGSVFLVSLGPISEQFYVPGPGVTSPNFQGSTLSYDSTSFTYVMKDGTVAVFLKSLASSYTSKADSGRVSTITRPSGEVITFNYYAYNLCIPSGQGCTNVPAHGLLSVVSSLGYQIRDPWQTPTGVNMAVDICNPTGTCFAGTPVTPVDDPVTFSQISSSTGLATIVTHAASGATMTYTRNFAGRVTSVNNGFATWTYTYVDSGDTRTATVIDPLGHTRVLTSSIAYGLVLTDTDGGGHTKTFHYDSAFRVDRITQAEGDYVQYTYDARGNVTERREVSKTPGTPPDIVLSASFDSACLNPKTCNQPNYVVDPRGGRTDYTYDATHGGVLTVTAPAGVSGVRPQTRYSYSLLPSYAKNSGGALVQVGSVWRPTGTSTCAITTSCAGGGDEVKTIVSYAGSSTLLPTSTTKGSGDGAIAATTTATYDTAGNVLTVDGPLAGAADTTRYRYDGSRRLVGVIGPSFTNNSGQVKNRAKRTTYSYGRVALIEDGVVASQADGDWAGFSSLQQDATTYDIADRMVKSSLAAGGATYSVTQYSYDAAGRTECVATRMNAAVFGALPSACTLGTTGTNGPDRIKHLLYDAADRRTAIVAGHGTGTQRTEIAVTYTPAGQQATVADALGHLTTYEYDGFNRLSKVRYPNMAGGGSSTTDFQAYTYDPSGNITQLNNRGSISNYTFDALNRTIYRDDPKGWYYYDNLGRPTYTYSGNSADKVIAHYFDALDRPTYTYDYRGGVWYPTYTGYDLAGNLTLLQWSDGFYVNYDHDAVGEITGIRENGSVQLSAYTYDDLGRRAATYRGNGAQTYYSYDAAGRLGTLTLDLAGTVQDQAYGFSYNSAGQIVGRSSGNDAYRYTSGASASRSYAINGQNQATTSGPLALTYDARGNLVGDGASTGVYDQDNQLTSVSTGLTLTYDPLGRMDRIAGAATTQLVYSGSDLITELDAANNVLRRYVPGPGTDEPLVWYEGSGVGDRRFLLPDERGSIVAVTNGSGSASVINTYDEYGVPGAANQGRYQYTGQTYIPEIGVYYYKARLYSPTLGRFYQTDPIGYADGMNWYAYVGNDPMNATDPTGLDGFEGNVGNGSSQNPWNADPFDPGPGCLERNGCFTPDQAYKVCGFSCTNEQASFQLTYDREYQKNQWMWAPVLAPVAVVGGLELAGASGVRGLASLVSKRACFEAGTLIQTQDGLKPIEQIKVGDMVLSRDPDTGETAYKPVLSLKPVQEKQIWEITFETRDADGGVKREVLRTTEEHPWRTAAGEWVKSSDLSSAVAVQRAKGGDAKVISVVQTSRVAPTYNFEVEGFHTYFVGAAQLWVHNSCVTYLYQKVGAAGQHLKIGITNNPAGRYTLAQLNGGRLRIVAEGTRSEMLALERQLHSALPIGSEEGQLFYRAVQAARGLKLPPY